MSLNCLLVCFSRLQAKYFSACDILKSSVQARIIGGRNCARKQSILTKRQQWKWRYALLIDGNRGRQRLMMIVQTCVNISKNVCVLMLPRSHLVEYFLRLFKYQDKLSNREQSETCRNGEPPRFIRIFTNVFSMIWRSIMTVSVS